MGQVHGFVRGAGCLCIRLEVGKWVLVLLGVLTAWWARQEGEGGQEVEGMAKIKKGLARKKKNLTRMKMEMGQEGNEYGPGG